MPVTVDINYKKAIPSGRDAKATFEYLSDREKTIPANFPGLEAFQKVQPEVYRWKFESLEYAGHKLQLQFVTRFTDKSPELVEMMTEAGHTGSRVQGHWKITPNGQTAQLEFAIQLSLELPIPFFLKAMAAPIAQKEMSRLFDRYLSNVGKALTT